MNMRALIEAASPRCYYHVTLTKNLPSILENGLEPKIGALSTIAGEEKPCIFMFYNLEAVEDALMNWLGDYISDDEPLALIQVCPPKEIKVSKGENEFGYEAICYSNIPPSYLKVLTNDVDTYF